jgi:hypothetical protein
MGNCNSVSDLLKVFKGAHDHQKMGHACRSFWRVPPHSMSSDNTWRSSSMIIKEGGRPMAMVKTVPEGYLVMVMVLDDAPTDHLYRADPFRAKKTKQANANEVSKRLMRLGVDRERIKATISRDLGEGDIDWTEVFQVQIRKPAPPPLTVRLVDLEKRFPDMPKSYRDEIAEVVARDGQFEAINRKRILVRVIP